MLVPESAGVLLITSRLSTTEDSLTPASAALHSDSTWADDFSTFSDVVVVVVVGFIATAFSGWIGKKVGVPSTVVETIGRRKPPPLASNSCAEILRTGVLAPEFSVLVNVWLAFKVAKIREKICVKGHNEK